MAGLSLFPCSTLERLTGYDIFVEQYREYSTDITTSFIFHAMGDGQIIDFDEFLTPSVENRLFVELEDCRIIRIQVGVVGAVQHPGVVGQYSTQVWLGSTTVGSYVFKSASPPFRYFALPVSML